MNFAPGFFGLAAEVSEGLLYCAIAGTLLASVVWFLLRLFPRRNSRTSFAVWFSTLLATALLPLAKLLSNSSDGVNSAGRHALVTVSTAWAWYAFLAWAGFAGIGLARVALATIQLRRIRVEAAAVDLKALDAD